MNILNETCIADLKTLASAQSVTQTGNFMTALATEWQHPSVDFLQLLSRKIDIKKQLFVAYDPAHDLRNTSDEPLDPSGWLKVCSILAHFINSDTIGIRWMAINTWFNACDVMPHAVLDQPCMKTLSHALDAFVCSR